MKLYDVLFGCTHKRMSFPLTRKPGGAAQTGTYIVCLDCGREFAYDWKRMRVLGESSPRPYVSAHVEVKAEAV